MSTTNKRFTLDSPTAWKRALQHRLMEQGRSRYQFVRECASEGVCSIHSGECLLADEGTVTGNRAPNLHTAIAMAALAGFDVVLVPRSR